MGGLKSLSKGQQEKEKSNSCATKCELQKDFVGKGVRGEDGKLSSFSQLCPSPEKSCTGQRYLVKEVLAELLLFLRVPLTSERHVIFFEEQTSHNKEPL